MSKRLSEITVDDIQALVAGDVAEGERLEFKRDLSNKKVRQDRSGEEISIVSVEAKAALAKELVAFANTSGGTLILGIAESEGGIAESISPIENCREVASSLQDALMNLIDPPLMELEVIHLPTDQDRGCILFRVPASSSSPHCCRGDYRCFHRVGSKSLPMSMQQVHRMAIDRWSMTANAKDRFLSRDHDYSRTLTVVVPERDRQIQTWRAYVRASALPTSAVQLSDIATRNAFQLPHFRLHYKDASGVKQPMNNFGYEGWVPILRGVKSTSSETSYADEYERCLYSDGLLETKAIAGEKLKNDKTKAIHAVELLRPMANTLMMVAVFRRIIDRPNLPFVFDLVWNVPRVANVIAPVGAQGLRTEIKPHEERNHLRDLVLGDESSIDQLWNEIQREFFQSFGRAVGNLYPIQFGEEIEAAYQTAMASG